MAPASGNWLSFTLPPPPPTPSVPLPLFTNYYSTGYADNNNYNQYHYQFFPQAPRLEDLLYGNLRAPLLDQTPSCNNHACAAAAQESCLPLRQTPTLLQVLPPAANSASSELEESSASVKTPPESGPVVQKVQTPAEAAKVTAASPASGGACQRTSVYRGVTRHRWTGRYEAHLWDNTCRREGQKRKGRQVYLGGYDKEAKAARAYDLAALKYWGTSATTNFPVESYSKEIEVMKELSKQEFIASLRRRSSGFSRGASMYRGVTRHHQHGRWQARIGRVAGNKDLYLGTFATEEEAAEAYDVAAIKFRGSSAVTNFELSRYDVEAIANNDLPIGTSVKKLKELPPATAIVTSSSQIRVTTDSTLVVSQYQNNSNSAYFHNLLQLPSGTSLSGLLPYYGENTVDLCAPSLYWFSATNQQNNQTISNQLTPRSNIC